jgi:formylglycine-generating enzyme required for sulfatase activity
VPDALAADEAGMKPYVEPIPGTGVSFAMVPIRGGRFRMGSHAGELGRKGDEGPVHEVEISPFWMGKHEVTWDEYQVFMLKLDLERRKRGESTRVPQDDWADAVSRPTPPYRPMDFEMGTGRHPAISMTQFAARQYTKWLSMKTGRFYRLPTEAEWEYACRARTESAYSFGNDPKELDRYAWYYNNSGELYHEVGLKAPNPWGLHDMHGNVAEWVLDAYDKAGYGQNGGRDPVVWPSEIYPRIVRGGSYNDDPEDLRSAARRASTKAWMVQDPQLPKSIWYHTDAQFVGLRVVRPLLEPSAEDQARAHDPDVPAVREVYERQRAGGR